MGSLLNSPCISLNRWFNIPANILFTSSLMKFPYRYAATRMARNRMTGLDANQVENILNSLLEAWVCYFRLGLVDEQLALAVKYWTSKFLLSQNSEVMWSWEMLPPPLSFERILPALQFSSITSHFLQIFFFKFSRSSARCNKNSSPVATKWMSALINLSIAINSFVKQAVKMWNFWNGLSIKTSPVESLPASLEGFGVKS